MRVFTLLVFVFVVFIACCLLSRHVKTRVYGGGFEPSDLVSSLRSLTEYRNEVQSGSWPVVFKDAVLRKLSKLDFIQVLTRDMENKIRTARTLPAVNKVGVDRVLAYYKSIADGVKTQLTQLKTRINGYAARYEAKPSAVLIAAFNTDQDITAIIDKLAGAKYPTDMNEVAAAKYGIPASKSAVSDKPILYPGNAAQRVNTVQPPVEILLNTGTTEDADDTNHPNHTLLWHKIGAVSRGQYPADKVRWVYLKRVGDQAANSNTHRTIASPVTVKLLENNLAAELGAPVGKSLIKLQQLIEDNVAPYKDVVSAADINKIEQIFASYKE
jgi:hypothetical protein